MLREKSPKPERPARRQLPQLPRPRRRCERPQPLVRNRHRPHQLIPARNRKPQTPHQHTPPSGSPRAAGFCFTAPAIQPSHTRRPRTPDPFPEHMLEQHSALLLKRHRPDRKAFEKSGNFLPLFFTAYSGLITVTLKNFRLPSRATVVRLENDCARRGVPRSSQAAVGDKEDEAWRT